MPKLTKRFVDNCTCPSKRPEIIFWDDQPKGFGLRVRPSGVKTFILQYRIAGHVKKLTLGRYGSITPDAARKEAKKQLGLILSGHDPVKAKREQKQAITISELCHERLKAIKGQVAPRTFINEESRIRCHVIPLIGHMPVKDVDRRVIEKFIKDISDGKTAKIQNDGKTTPVKGGKGIAIRTVGMLQTILNRAVPDILHYNPAAFVKKPTTHPREIVFHN